MDEESRYQREHEEEHDTRKDENDAWKLDHVTNHK